MENARTSGYYLEREEKYWKQLERLIESSDQVLPKHLNASLVGQVRDETRQEFHKVLSALPYIGGDGNMFTFTLVSSAAALAYLRVLEGHGLSEATSGQVLNAVYDDVFSSLPGLVKWWLRTSEFSRGHQNKLRAYARQSQLREYPGDWVLIYVEGDGETHDFGCDYTECAVLKFFRQMGAEKYMPYVCVMDFTKSRALRTGLRRTTSLYYGGDCCDFRYKKNRLGQSPLPIEDLPEYRNV
jgi:hypothetical protein